MVIRTFTIVTFIIVIRTFTIVTVTIVIRNSTALLGEFFAGIVSDTAWQGAPYEAACTNMPA